MVITTAVIYFNVVCIYLYVIIAIISLILKLHAITPPNALIGSHAKAFLKEINGELFIETPHGLACLIITVVGFFLIENKISSDAKISL